MKMNFSPGLKSFGLDPNMVEKLIEAQKLPLKQAESRKEKVEIEKEEIEKLTELMNNFSASLKGLRTKYDFYKLKLDSSHPDILDGNVASGAMLGTYELEVRSLAKSEKELAYGFPDKNDTPVGLGYMLIQRDDGEEVEVVVEPYTTLSQLANQINDSDAGVRAMVINTKFQPDPYRLLVISEKSGKEAKILIDEDTTFMEFKEQVRGRNLDVLFEDVPVTDNDNILEELISGVTLNARRSEPGTRVQVSVVHDVEATLEAIKSFVTSYNDVASFINGQFVENQETGEFGVLSSDSSIKYIMRQLQSGVVRLANGGGKYSTLAQVGITTDSKTGSLNMDESKVKAALSEDYDSVAKLFIQTQRSQGVAGILSDRVKNFQDPVAGVLKSRMRGLNKVIKNHDQDIERRQRRLEAKEQMIRKKFTTLESTLAELQGQSKFLAARLANKK